MAFWNRKELVTPGQIAPQFSLCRLDGSPVSREELLSSGPVVLAFFKTSCPTCQLTLPYLNLLQGSGSVLQSILVSQNDSESTREFADEFGLTTEILIDRAEDGYPASNAFGISHVPTAFLLEPDGRVSFVSDGFIKKDLAALGDRAGVVMFDSSDSVPEYKPG